MTPLGAFAVLFANLALLLVCIKAVRDLNTPNRPKPLTLKVGRR